MRIIFPGESAEAPRGARSAARAGDRAAPSDGGRGRRQARAAAGRRRPGGLRLRRGGDGRRPDRRAAVRALRPRQELARDLQLHVSARSRRRAPGPERRRDRTPHARRGPVSVVRRAPRSARRRRRARHPHVNFAVVAKSPLPRILTFAEERGWRRLRLLSSAGNTYNRDYHAETLDGHSGRC